MNTSEKRTVRVLLAGMDLLERLRAPARLLLRPIANAPFLARRLGVLVRAFLGATAFDLHDVDLERGRIGIGGVEEILAGSRIIELLHTVLAARLGEEQKNEALYEIGLRLCKWEVSQSFEHGRWAPRALVPLIMNGSILDEVQRDPLVARFFGKTMNMVSRLITDEGGWGHLEFDFSALPLKVTLSHSQEARWLAGAPGPVCNFYAGIVAGYASAISGHDMQAREVECSAAGAPRCVFHVTRVGDAPTPPSPARSP